MPRPHRAAAIVLLATALAAAAATARAQSASPKPAAAKPGASAPARAEPARFAVDYGTCKDFLALPPDLRGLVVAWTAGRYHKLDRWVLDEATARKVIAGVEQACENKPDGLFRYQVVAEVNKLK